MTITIYKIFCIKKAFDWERDEYYSLEPWPGNEYPYDGYDDGGHIYQLPSRFIVKFVESKFFDGEVRVVFDMLHKKEVPIVARNNSPALIDCTGKLHLLSTSIIDSFFKL